MRHVRIVAAHRLDRVHGLGQVLGVDRHQPLEGGDQRGVDQDGLAVLAAAVDDAVTDAGEVGASRRWSRSQANSAPERGVEDG